MKIKTTRFGEMDIAEERIITFTEDILGFPGHRKFVMLDHLKNSPFKWLQSVEKEALAFVLTDPLHIMSEYRAEIGKDDIADIKFTALDKAVVLCFVNIADGCKSVTVNLLGPIIVNPEKMLAKQVVLLNSPYSIKHNVLDSFQHKDDKKSAIK